MLLRNFEHFRPGLPGKYTHSTNYGRSVEELEKLTAIGKNLIKPLMNRRSIEKQSHLETLITICNLEFNYKERRSVDFSK